jgi:N-methylhydantoinase A
VRYRVGIDVGGTFTDLLLRGTDGSVHTKKVLTTPQDYGRGVIEGLQAALAELGAQPAAVERLVHATTVATNTILEGKGALTGLLTTRGFRDVLDMRRLRIPEMYVLNYRKPEPLVPRRLRRELDERLGPRGEVRTPLDEASVHAAIERLVHERVQAVAIALLHSYANPAHEQRAAAIVRERMPHAFVTCSCEILPEIREYERTSTTVINAYLGPALERYFASLKHHLAAIDVSAPLQVMKSDGALMTVDAAMERPAYLVESGPAAGVIGAARVTQAAGQLDAITLDMGGTTAKAAIVEQGVVETTGDYEVGAGINLSSKLVMGGGYALKLPVIDLSEIGAGGGSLITIDKGGHLHVGPESAGALPGPIAYDRGGAIPTFTDALVALGYLNPDYLVGGGLRLNAAAARDALAEQIATPLGQPLLDTAYGIFQLAGGTMVRAVKAVSTYRGRDPRDFALFAFGGNGPVVATEIAQLLEMTRIVIPPHPGVFSAYGLLAANVRHEVSRAFLRRLGDLDASEMRVLFARLEADVRARMAAQGHTDFTLQRSMDLRYIDQAHELRIAVPSGERAFDAAALGAAFNEEHERTYGHRAEAAAVESVALRVAGQVEATDALQAIAPRRATRPDTAVPFTRLAYFGRSAGQVRTPIVGRADLVEGWRAGPLIVEEYDSTCVVPPGWRARCDRFGNIEIVVVPEKDYIP